MMFSMTTLDFLDEINWTHLENIAIQKILILNNSPQNEFGKINDSANFIPYTRKSLPSLRNFSWTKSKIVYIPTPLFLTYIS